MAALEAGLVSGFAEIQPERYAVPGVPAPLTLGGADATLERVREALPGTRLLHVACHGTVDLRHPRASGLWMAEDAVGLRGLVLPLPGGRPSEPHAPFPRFWLRGTPRFRELSG